ncbi:asparagine--tRNA ligase-like [Hylaeus volcanicus]|uniref:asparagine--tRNA ligase-like n=1 Tax=Hylaeus volcanicus TaxID=313075 RepID=UPI0023B850A2|nr:asparagine--tRNA ligase-like [Hylaeus volcanicus]
MLKEIDTSCDKEKCNTLICSELKETQSYNERYRLQCLLDCENFGLSLCDQIIKVCGWSRSVRVQGGGSFVFITLSDGSTPRNLQIIVTKDIPDFETLTKCGTGCSFCFTGVVTKSPGKNQHIELALNDKEKHSFINYGKTNAAKYPLSKKQHGREFLRSILHLRPRSNLMGCVSRIRSNMAMATHSFFHKKGFLYVHTPIITDSDCEGAGEMFQVTTLLDDDASKIPTYYDKATNKTLVDYKKDFFTKKVFLTVSGQLSVENYCCSLCDVYTFGPTFRAENSHTSRHLAEFWMIEPELAFANLDDNMHCAESYLKYCVTWALKHCQPDLLWLDENIEKGLIRRLENIIAEPFERLSYTNAIVLLEKHCDKFEIKPEWGMDLGAEHERFITEIIFNKPVIVFDYPKDLKSFYMKQQPDMRTVAAMDVLVPKIGEVIGGSQREDNLEILERKLEEKGLNKESYWWYLQLREYGTIPHSGFGLGFERLIMLVTGVDNIRDVIPYPRYVGHAEF